ncbi:MAG: septum formation protein Maf [Clostridiales bacterium]|nr:septum formation protein Maf [Clostridiales bacterium]
MLILASASPRRREILSLLTDDFEVMAADTDEREIEERLRSSGAAEVAKGLAAAKARAVYEMLGEERKRDSVVIGADTSVVCEDEILGKPADKEDAVRMLTMLSGKVHSVITGVALISGGREAVFEEESKVEFYPLDGKQKALIEGYVSTDEPYDKAGAYGIQGKGALLVRKIEGDYLNIVGLPLSRLKRELDDLRDAL